MYRHYFIVALRSMGRNLAHSLINIFGLSIAIATCLLIMLFVRDEWTFDQFHSMSDRIYRVWAREDHGGNEKFFYTTTPFPMGPALKDNIPEIECQVRISNMATRVKVGDKMFNETLMIAGRDFFKIFSFKLTEGNRTTVLQNPRDIVITREMAKKYFGDDDPLNKTLTLIIHDSPEDFTVRGVSENIPSNSSIRFKLMISDLNYPEFYSERTLTSAWFNIIPETYVLLRKDADVNTVESKFPPLFKKVLGAETYKNSKYQAGLQPLTDIHLDTNFPAGIARVNNPKYSYILSGVAGLILLIACINYISLSVGRSLKRAREVGIRKVSGAFKSQLVSQFISEALIITLISLFTGMLLSAIFLPVFNTLSGKQLVIEPDGFLLLAGAGLSLLIGILAGFYPAFILSSFNPVSVLKGSARGVNNRQNLRRLLVVIQLVISVFLISSTLIMRKQFNYIRNKDLGFVKEQLVTIPLNVPGNTNSLTEYISKGFQMSVKYRNEFSSVPGVENICAATHDFGKGTWTNAGYTDNNGVYRTFFYNTVDDKYIPVLDIKMVAGRNFSAENPSDYHNAIIINEAFAKEYGWKDPVGKRLPGPEFKNGEIIGVVKDFNFSPLYTRVQPLVLSMDPQIIFDGIENIDIGDDLATRLFLRLHPGNIPETMYKIKTAWDRLTGKQEFVYNFVDQDLDKQYKSDKNLGSIISYSSLLAILIASLGLYGLVSMALQNRIKEIGIRKVFGASRQSLVILLSREYILMVLISLLISVPVTIFVMKNWLHNFEYKIAISWQIFVLAGLIALIIAIMTVNLQTIKAALSRPIETLKHE